MASKLPELICSGCQKVCLALPIEILPFFRSDHSYLFLEIDILPSSQRGPGVWKFNTPHVKDEGLRSLVNDFWTTWRNEKPRFSLLSTWWDAEKVRLKSIIYIKMRLKYIKCVE